MIGEPCLKTTPIGTIRTEVSSVHITTAVSQFSREKGADRARHSRACFSRVSLVLIGIATSINLSKSSSAGPRAAWVYARQLNGSSKFLFILNYKKKRKRKVPINRKRKMLKGTKKNVSQSSSFTSFVRLILIVFFIISLDFSIKIMVST